MRRLYFDTGSKDTIDSLRKIEGTKLNIGCGWEVAEGFLNIDIAEEVKPNLCWNIETGLPFDDNSISAIYSEQCLEHVRPEYWKYVFNEMGRVSKNGAIWLLDLPFDNQWNRCNADHYRTFTFASFAQNTVDTTRAYYIKGFLLKDLTTYPNRFFRMLAVMFPMFVRSIRFKFEVVKK